MVDFISVLGVVVSILGILLSEIPDSDRDSAKVSYVIANDGANGDLTNAGGHLPDVRMWDETGEHLGSTWGDGQWCDEGSVTCTSTVYTNEAPTYTLFTGNENAICIAWTGIAFPGGNQKYSFHPGQFAHACDNRYGGGDTAWYYAGNSVPGINYNEETVYCAWVDLDGSNGIVTTGFQVHWPEFRVDEAAKQPLDYYCANKPPVHFHTDYDPSQIIYWTPGGRAGGSTTPRSTVQTSSSPSRPDRLPRRQATDLARDPRIIKSKNSRHRATELCDRTKNAAGQNFVSYAESMLCYMPTKTLYPFCEDVSEDGAAEACWDDEANKIVVKGDAGNARIALPDMSHINKTIIWE